MKYLSKERFTLRQVVIMLTIVFLGVAVISYGAVTIPNSFTSGETISSSEVNANFTAVANQMPAVKTAYFATHSFTSSYTNIGSLSVTAPGSGYIYLSANGAIYTENNADHHANVWIGISNVSAGTPVNGNQTRIYIDAGATDDFFEVPYGVNAVFPVSAGTYTFYLVGIEYSDNETNGCEQNRLTAMFIPNAL